MKLYVALGDSISIDRYPELETGMPNIGAASLFSCDLRARHPDLEFHNLTADGATTEDVLREQLPRIQDTSDPAIVTITVGGNDLLVNLGAPHPPTNLVEGMMERLTRIVDDVIRKLPNALVLVGTVYDPSDNTGTLNGRELRSRSRVVGPLQRIRPPSCRESTERPAGRYSRALHGSRYHCVRNAPLVLEWVDFRTER